LAPRKPSATKPKPKAPPTFKLDIFDLLNAADCHDLNYLSRQPEEAQKAFAGRVVLRWMSQVEGANSELYLMLVNELVNIDFDSLSKYPDLQYRLMAACGVGRRQRHGYLKTPKRVNNAAKLQSFLLLTNPLASTSEINMLLSNHTKESFAELVNYSGISAQETKDLIDAFEAQEADEDQEARA
jgi:hypothetical protein